MVPYKFAFQSEHREWLKSIIEVPPRSILGPLLEAAIESCANDNTPYVNADK